MSASPPLRGLLLDVGHTLLRTAEPVEEVYARVAADHGVDRSPARIRSAFRDAFASARPRDGRLRYQGDGRPFWREVVRRSTGSSDPDLFEALYDHYAHADAWRLSPGALPCIDALREAGLAVALVSDWDQRLRPLLAELGLLDRVDHAAISCEVGHEKPDPRLFLAACTAVGLAPARCVHVGDDPQRDAAGARMAGCTAWVFGEDVADFAEIRARLLPTAPPGPRAAAPAADR